MVDVVPNASQLSAIPTDLQMISDQILLLKSRWQQKHTSKMQKTPKFTNTTPQNSTKHQPPQPTKKHKNTKTLKDHCDSFHMFSQSIPSDDLGNAEGHDVARHGTELPGRKVVEGHLGPWPWDFSGFSYRF